jgi:ribose 5-phosphate isomerase B
LHLAVASDRAGFALKERVRECLGKLGHTVEDLGTGSTAPVDYLGLGEAVAEESC